MQRHTGADGGERVRHCVLGVVMGVDAETVAGHAGGDHLAHRAALQERAEADLGFPLLFIEQDFVSAQRTAAVAPASYDIYDQCFHNLDIVWNWRAIQSIETKRITHWNDLDDLTRTPRPRAPHGMGTGLGDAPMATYVPMSFSPADLSPVMLLGALGGGALLAAFAAYTIEKKTKLRPGEVPFGQGNIRGVAAPESANNAGSQTSFIPLLTLGIPPNAVMALMVGAMTIHNIQPGPQVMTSNPELFWGLIASMWIGNAMLVILNLPLIGLWIKLLTVPYRWLYPSIVLFCAVGVYSTNNNTWDIWMVGGFGLVGYIFHKLGTEPAPLLLGFILGPMMEENLRRALLLSRGDWSVFVTRPLSAGLLAAAALLLVIVLLPAVKNKREEAFVED